MPNEYPVSCQYRNKLAVTAKALDCERSDNAAKAAPFPSDGDNADGAPRREAWYINRSCRVRSDSGPRPQAWHHCTSRCNSAVYAREVCRERVAFAQERRHCDVVVAGAKRVGVRMRVAESPDALQPTDQRDRQAINCRRHHRHVGRRRHRRFEATTMGFEERDHDLRHLRGLRLGRHQKPAALPSFDDGRHIDEQAAHGGLGAPRIGQCAVPSINRFQVHRSYTGCPNASAR